MDRNLGASRAATSMDDEQAYGDLYQWGRAADGHEKRNSPTTTTLSTEDSPSHDNFIIVPNEPRDWRNPQNNNLWQGVNGRNNPCPEGYRLPTLDEWEVERLSWSINNATGGFNSPLKLPVAGRRWSTDGEICCVGAGGYYLSSTLYSDSARYLLILINDADKSMTGRRAGTPSAALKIKYKIPLRFFQPCGKPFHATLIRHNPFAHSILLR